MKANKLTPARGLGKGGSGGWERQTGTHSEDRTWGPAGGGGWGASWQAGSAIVGRLASDSTEGCREQGEGALSSGTAQPGGVWVLLMGAGTVFRRMWAQEQWGVPKLVQ